jgi:protein TonB
MSAKIINCKMKKYISLFLIFLLTMILSCNLPIQKDAKPSFIGMDFREYLKNHIKYPLIEKEAGIQGSVLISFTVEKDGSISNVHPIKEVPGAPEFTKEAMRVISKMPDWNPGIINGEPVRIELKQPVRFALK